jgi:hypothetical protein
MVEPAINWLHSEKLAVKKEFAMPFGICDLVGVSLSEKNIRMRIDNGQFQTIGSLLRVELLNEIPDIGTSKGITRDTLLKKFEYAESKSNLEREISTLLSRKFVFRTRTGSLQKLDGWVPLQDRIVAIELKLNRTREAVSQAIRNSRFADESYIGLPENSASRLYNSRLISELRDYGVGVLALQPKSCKILLNSRIRKKYKSPTMQLYCADRFWPFIVKDTST